MPVFDFDVITGSPAPARLVKPAVPAKREGPPAAPGPATEPPQAQESAGGPAEPRR